MLKMGLVKIQELLDRKSGQVKDLAFRVLSAAPYSIPWDSGVPKLKSFHFLNLESLFRRNSVEELSREFFGKVRERGRVLGVVKAQFERKLQLEQAVQRLYLK